MSQPIIDETSGYRKPGLRATGQNMCVYIYICIFPNRSCVMNVRANPVLPSPFALPGLDHEFLLYRVRGKKKSSKDRSRDGIMMMITIPFCA